MLTNQRELCVLIRSQQRERSSGVGKLVLRSVAPAMSLIQPRLHRRRARLCRLRPLQQRPHASLLLLQPPREFARVVRVVCSCTLRLSRKPLPLRLCLSSPLHLRLEIAPQRRRRFAPRPVVYSVYEALSY
jgi:hypothetical protein